VTDAFAPSRSEYASRTARARAGLRRSRPYVLFALSWMVLNAFVNIRYPAREAPWWFLVPSIDIAALFACYAALGRYGRRVPSLVHALIVGFLVFVRLFRIGEGIELSYLSRPLNLWSDLPLVPELVRLIYTTTPPGKLLLAAVLGTPVVIGAVIAVSLALRYSERFLVNRRHALAAAIVIGVFALLSPLTRRSRYADHYIGALGASVMPRLIEEADFILHASGYRSERLAEIRRVQDELERTPSDLRKLQGKDVLLFLIEAYGVTVRTRPLFVSRLESTFDLFEAQLERHGFSVASAVLDSPTYGGSSWLAHATLATGVQVSNQFDFSLLKSSAPRTLAGFFRAAGYRTVLAQPGTTRPLPGDAYRPFEHHYFAANFDYRGPRFAFAPMPDQYVVDFIDRRERVRRERPLFIEVVLVSSHLPWTEHAPIIDDWSTIGDGAIFESVEKIRTPATWREDADGSEGYAHSIAYDLDVLRRYIGARIRDETLIIIVGDHQPAAQVTLDSPDRGVPIHVISRDRATVEVFLTRGYTPGMRPDAGRPRAAMREFLPDFLRDFSTPR
jgi:hypothetical protein